MKTKLISNNSKDLILFLTGWGCDDVQFQSMTSSKDVLLCWDYTDLELNFDFSKYENICLLTYSAGVYVAGLIADKLPKFKLKIAINGNPLMFDEYFGINENLINTMYKLNEDNYLQFRKDFLVYNNEEFEYFNNHTSIRTFDSCATELKNLEEYSKTKFTPIDYDIALLSDNDKIFNPTTQRKYFKASYIILNNQAHNVFYKIKTYDDIFNIIENNKNNP